MKATAVARSAVSIVNAIPAGKGASLGIALPLTATVKLDEHDPTIRVEVRGEPCDGTLSRIAARKTLDRFGFSAFGADVVTESDIPVSRGLKSSSAAANAVCLATLSAIGKLGKLRDEELLTLGVEAATEARVTITGAYDDACASFFGGLCVTDNVHRVLLKRYPPPADVVAVVHVPAERIEKPSLGSLDFSILRDVSETAFDLALQGDWQRAMKTNGLVVSSLQRLDVRPTLALLRAGALAAGVSGTGPATAGLVPVARVKEAERALREFGGRVLVSDLNDRRAEVVA
ncbi:MAG: shikimate kinase [Methanobacteriota archaeon]